MGSSAVEPAAHFNRMAMFAGLIWAIILHMLGRIALSFLSLSAGQPARQALSGALFFTAFLAYPVALTAVMQERTPVWWNATTHATAGSGLAFIGIFLLSALTSGLWIETALSALALWLLLQVFLPWLRSYKLLRNERGKRKAVWKQLDALQLGQLLFLRIPRLR